MEPLRPWMSYLLRFAGCYNLLVGFGLLVLYHEVFKTIGLPKPDLLMYVQLVGILVALFGVGYWMVALNPIENRNVLMLGFLSKLFGSILGTGYFMLSALPRDADLAAQPPITATTPKTSAKLSGLLLMEKVP